MGPGPAHYIAYYFLVLGALLTLPGRFSQSQGALAHRHADGLYFL